MEKIEVFYKEIEGAMPSNGVTDAGELKSLAHHKITKYAKNDNTLWVLNNQAA